MNKEEKIILLGLVLKSIELIDNSEKNHESEMWKQSLHGIVSGIEDSISCSKN